VDSEVQAGNVVQSEQRKQNILRRFVMAFWRVAWIVVIFLWLHPVSYRWTRITILSLFSFLWGASLVLWWRIRLIKFLCGGLALTVLGFAFWPGVAPDKTRLQQAYTKALLSYKGTKYVWGGENHFGIDCSGLVRRGLIDAMLKEGFATWNPGLIRQSFFLRWYDCAAIALQKGYRNQTRNIFSAQAIDKLDLTKLETGDLAVTATGIHILAYVGSGTWIESDPDVGCVITLKSSDNNPWLKEPVEILRWRILE
jgi:hypothetical protein